MRLKSFEVKSFRSVADSGVVDTDDVTALIGINESGKSNLLLPLWKFRPVKDGELKPTSDYPRKLYNDFRKTAENVVFISTIFEADDETKRELSRLTSSAPEHFDLIEAKRYYDGNYGISFPKAPRSRAVDSAHIRNTLDIAERELGTLSPLKSEEDYATSIRAAVGKARALVPETGVIGLDVLNRVEELLPEREAVAKTSSIAPRYTQLRDALQPYLTALQVPVPNNVKEARLYALNRLPHFVYYTNYGNLDSEIYLPHVIANMKRDDLGSREEAKVRTLKVLFEFVGLQPEEILELGREFRATTTAKEPTEEEIAEIAEKKKTRSILLQSASTKLTQEFRDWWKQGEYRFRFEADGDHFRIWVSDDKRPEEIELEGRSTGLQWFLSFYLVFLVESKDAHAGSVLLLDEPGMSLHPLAQRDLSLFFEGLAAKNQIVYTTHSPFLIDADHLDRARKVYVAGDGTTKATADLKAVEGNKGERASGYAVHAALGLTVAESLLYGCTTVVIEGLSDQMYLSTIKTLLIAAGKITPNREIIFPPAGGAKGVKAVVAILSGRDEQLPIALFDSDTIGNAVTRDLRQGLYQQEPSRVLQVGQFVPDLPDGAEIEDLIPSEYIINALDRWIKSVEYSFEETYKPGSAIVPQIEAWAKKENVTLQVPAWKVEIAKRVKVVLLSKGVASIAPAVIDAWAALFQAVGA